MVHGYQAAFLEFGQIEAERGDIGAQIGDPLVEGNKHAGFVVVEGAFDQEMWSPARSCRSRGLRIRASAARPAARRR